MKFSLTVAAIAATLSTQSAAKPVGKPVDLRFIKAPGAGWSTSPERGSSGSSNSRITPGGAPGTMDNSSSSSGSRVLISNPGHIYLTEYTEAGAGAGSNGSSSSSASFGQQSTYQVSGNPSWMAFREPNYIYAVDEYSDETRLFQLSASNATDGLTKVIGQKGSSGVVHLAFTEDGSRMIGAGYGSGKIDIWNTENHGLELVKTITVPVTNASAVSHPHQSVLDPSGRFFVVNDLGLNQLYLIDTQDDAFDIVATIPVSPSGAGPRHGSFYPTTGAQATHYIVACELSSQLIVFELQYDADTIAFKEVAVVSTLNPQDPGATPDKAAAGELAIVGADDLYVSNRLTGDATDNIAHFKIATSSSNHTAPGSGSAPGHGRRPPMPHFRQGGGHGRGSGSGSGNGTDSSTSSLSLTFADQVSSGGVLPRMFSVSEDRKSLFVGNQKGADGIVVLARGANGTLAATPKAVIPGSVFGADNATNGPQYVKQI